MCMIGVKYLEECCNGKVNGNDAENVSSMDGTARMQSTNNEILFGINSSPPCYLVINYALQVSGLL